MSAGAYFFFLRPPVFATPARVATDLPACFAAVPAALAAPVAPLTTPLAADFASLAAPSSCGCTPRYAYATVPFARGVEQCVAWLDEDPPRAKPQAEMDAKLDRIVQQYGGEY